MATTFMHVDVVMTSTTNFPKDDKHITFGVVSLDGPAPDASASIIADALEAAFALDGPGGADLSSYMSPGVKRGAADSAVKVYDVTGKLGLVEVNGKLRPIPHGSPASIATWGLATAASAVALPDNVACVITKRALNWEDQPIEVPDGADLQGKVDRPRQRYSGRCYIGPLNVDAQHHVNGISRPKPDFRTTVNQAFDELIGTLFTDHDLYVAVWSKTDAIMRPVVEVQVDDRWDTQKRRLPSATTREAVDTSNGG